MVVPGLETKKSNSSISYPETKTLEWKKKRVKEELEEETICEYPHNFYSKKNFLCKEGYCQDTPGTSLTLQWLGLHASNVEGTGSIPGWGTKTPHTVWPKKLKKTKQNKTKHSSFPWFVTN